MPFCKEKKNILKLVQDTNKSRYITLPNATYCLSKLCDASRDNRDMTKMECLPEIVTMVFIKPSGLLGVFINYVDKQGGGLTTNVNDTT